MKNTITLLIPLMLMAVAANTSATQPSEVYNYYCAQCHGSDGKGNGPNVTKDFATDPRDFSKVEDMQKLSDDDIRNVILNGGASVSKSSLMPAWSGTLSDEEVDGLVGVLRCISQSKAKL
ncbi:MAG: cytochrome C [Gammaproteobacteria bacterium]|jgi:cytochrome c oxidase cbb3-type subunit 3|nr:cytochrome C [Gammaproteobacteria bacterium]|tara:strand:+ start:762 stop:1121 length:360 start_codon:yes stop_codon:yes gene_type:complete